MIGGGDFANDRIIPETASGLLKEKREIIVRNPYSTRPYQHVLEPVTVYLMLAKAQYENKALAGNYNVGPDDSDCWTTGELVDLFCKTWKQVTGEDAGWKNVHDGGPHEGEFPEAGLLQVKENLWVEPPLECGDHHEKNCGVVRYLVIRGRCKRLHRSTDPGISADFLNG